MAISIKTDEQIEKMRKAGALTESIFDVIKPLLVHGVTTLEIDRAVNHHIVSNGGMPSFLNYNGFPFSACISTNEEVIHGMPSIRTLKNGDIVSIDVGAIVDGYHGDAARTFAIGEISPIAQKLIDVTKQSFFEGIKFAKAGCHLFQISGAVQQYCEENGFSVVRDFVGHGIGSKMHEDPAIPNYKPPSRGVRLDKNMTLAIEPMVNIGDYGVNILSDGWTVVTNDGSLSAHYENTVRITDGEPEILTLH